MDKEEMMSPVSVLSPLGLFDYEYPDKDIPAAEGICSFEDGINALQKEAVELRERKIPYTLSRRDDDISIIKATLPFAMNCPKLMELAFHGRGAIPRGFLVERLLFIRYIEVSTTVEELNYLKKDYMPEAHEGLCEMWTKKRKELSKS